MITLTIDGRVVRAAEGSYLLEAARAAGIDIPTLCHHPDLEPWGGCRLCLVDVGRPEWGEHRKMVVSCMYPVEDGLLVSTRSERVLETRRVVLDLLLARCPDTPLVKELAAAYGVAETTYRAAGPRTDCILCGLCARVCESYATSAIAAYGRGAAKDVGPFNHEPPAACVGCGACALICPTGHIEAERTATEYRIWGRSFPTACCVVDEAHCVGCGACEEACPFRVARVVVQRGGRRVAVIPSEHCRGCGACVGACPGGAIEQAGLSFAALARRRGALP